MRGLWFIFVFTYFAFVLVPLVVLCGFSFFSFDPQRHGEIIWNGLSWYQNLSQNQSLLQALDTSLTVALGASLLSGVLGLTIGLSKSKLFTSATFLPLALPDILQGISLLSFFIWIGIPLGKVSIVLAHTSFGAAYVAQFVKARKSQFDNLLVDAAEDLGASPFKVFTSIYWPHYSSSVLAGMLVVFTFSFDDFIISFFTAGPGESTLPLKVYSMLKFGITPEVNALSSVILAISFIFILMAYLQRAKVGRVKI